MDKKSVAHSSALQAPVDSESAISMNDYLRNVEVNSLSWNQVSVTVPDRKTKQPKNILEDVSGRVEAGEMMAIMGPSGCGKTTLLNVLARREASAKAQVVSNMSINDRKITDSDFKKVSRFVEAEDALIGSLTVKETLHFAAQLSPVRHLSAAERKKNVDELLHAFGLVRQADTIVGTLIKKGISTGQKRRLSVASQLTSAPKILFLDEPTSGLDSAASFNVMSYVKEVARANNLIVIASIHQPSTTTFELFDKLLLLSEGKTCYLGKTEHVKSYFDGIGFPMPNLINPADFILNLTNVDFDRDTDAARSRLATIQNAWKSSILSTEVKSFSPPIEDAQPSNGDEFSTFHKSNHGSMLRNTWIILHRNWIKSRRDILVYGVRFAMYMGLAIMVGTVWLRLKPVQENIQALSLCIFFSSAFMSFMAVVYVPAFIEDRQVFIKDRANGLYGSTAFMLSNFLVGLPYLFIIALTSSTFLYWMVNLRPNGTAFLTWIMWNYLNLLAAESLVVLMSSLFPNFVGALALTAMVNALWMTCNGFVVPLTTLNAFYKYVFYYINYQSWVFRGLASNEFGFRNYACGPSQGLSQGGQGESCYCMYDTPLRDQCLVQGSAVLTQYGVEGRNGGGAIHQAKWVGIMLGIIVGLRVLGLVAMRFRR